MKRSIIYLTKREYENEFHIANLFAHSLLSKEKALLEYNRLEANQIKSIRKEFSRLDEIRKALFPKDMPKETLNELHNHSVMVDANILAIKYDIDPLIVMMCCVMQDETCGIIKIQG